MFVRDQFTRFSSGSAFLSLFFFFLLSAQCNSAIAGPHDPRPLSISLASDQWGFETDPHDTGTSQTWWTRPLTGTIKLPGSMTESGLGEDITTTTPWTQAQIRLTELFANPSLAPYLQPDNIKIPFWLTPLKYYRGAAWYQRPITVPPEMAGQSLTLFLERAHWRTDVWIDDQPFGFQDSLSTPHEYSLGTLPAGEHRITIRVDNRMQVNVGLNAHSVTDHTQTNWNGIIGKIELRAQPSAAISDVQVYPDPSSNSVRVVTEIHQPVGQASSGIVEVDIAPPHSTHRKAAGAGSRYQSTSTTTSIETIVELDGAVQLWDEFNPNLYRATVRLVADDQTAAPPDTRTVAFGFREIGASGTDLTLNNKPLFLRGTLECCIFPLTGYPPTDVAAWRRIMLIVRSHGLNHIRFHSWCPPEAAFTAADEEGIYLSIECASWAYPGQDAAYDKWLYEESRRIVRAYGNHPSFCMFLYGNEPLGDKPKFHRFLNEFVSYWKARDSRFMVSGGAGWPALANDEFHVLQEPRMQRWGEGLRSRINARPPETMTNYDNYVTSYSVPIISHELGQWCAYPNLEERAKYTGVTRALNFDIFADTLEEHHMGDQARDFLMASGKLQALCYKEDIESALRTKGMGGFQLLDLHDFPGQGTALVGVLDPFWDSKGYITAEEFRRFSGPVVPLALLPKRVFTNADNLTCTVELANFGRSALKGAIPEWELSRSDGEVVASGKFPSADLPLGNGLEIGSINQPLNMITQAEKLNLQVSLPGTDARNSWDIWVYPSAIENAVPADILLTHNLDSTATERLKNGGKVLLIPRPGSVKGGATGPIKAGFSSIFWNTAWTGNQAPHTLGILCNPQHPALEFFPTEFHSNWQWWYLIHNSPVMLLDSFSSTQRPIIQMIDNWATNRKLGYLFESQYLGGKLVICSMQLNSPKAKNPVSRQMLHSILEYMKSDNFAPQEELTAEQIGAILK